MVLVGSLVLILGLTPPVQKAPAPQKAGAVTASPLVRAREAYNSGDYDQAITLAEEARTTPDTADAASVVSARAHLERYRKGLAEDDLANAREALKGLATAKLDTHDYNEYLIGLGESLYYEERFGAAAECFWLALTPDDDSAASVRDRLFDWWAGSLDQQAQIGPEADRKGAYQRIFDEAQRESARHDRSAAAAYWLAAAARGADDLERAWGAAIAGWVRAPSSGERGTTLRADLDRLMTLAIIPERARKLLPTGDLQPVIQRLSAEWQSVKEKWGGA